MPTRPITREKAKTQFPPPRFYKVKDTPTGQNAWKFFEYWLSIPAEMTDLIEVKVYRTFPIINFQLVDPNRDTIHWDIISGPCPFSIENYEQEFLEKYGSGGWKLLLNEKGVSGPVMECMFRAIDQDAYPCKIDLRTLVKGSFGNEEYVGWARRNNIKLPWDDDSSGDGEGEDMSGVNDALKTMVEHGQKLAEKNMEMVEQVAEAKIAAIENQQPEPPTEDEHAVRESMKLVTDTAREAISMMKETSGKQHDTVEIITAVGSLMNKAQPALAGDGGGDKMIEITKLLLETQAKGYEAQISGLRETLETIKSVVMRGPVGEQQAVVAAAPKTFVEQLKEAKEMADLFANFGGGNNGGDRDRDRDDEPPRVERAPEKSLGAIIAENLPAIGMILAAGANIFYNMKLKPGETPQSPAEALKQSPLAGATATAGAVPHGAGPGPAQGVQPTPEQVRAQWVRFVEQLRGPFLAHFFSTETLPVGRDMNYKASGYTLAYFLQTDGTGARATDNGRRVYLAVKDQLGPQGLDQLVRQDFELWSKVGSMQQRYAQFMGEFFTYDDWLEKQVEGDDGDEDPAATTKKTAA